MKKFWVIEQYDRFFGVRTGIFVAGKFGGSNYLDTTGWLPNAKKFRWEWTAKLWLAIYCQSYWLGFEWHVTQHEFTDIGSACGVNPIWR